MKSKYILLVLAIFTSSFGCQLKGPPNVPAELQGVWKTTSPKYKDVSIELTNDSITILNKLYLEEMIVNIISKIEKIQEEKQILYIIHHENRKGLVYKFSFYYDPSKDTMRFKNQKQIEWRKVKS